MTSSNTDPMLIARLSPGRRAPKRARRPSAEAGSGVSCRGCPPKGR
ncbi:hypothetical protein AB0C84_31895 [Actinomadura sp. NPDC048955]|nr:hypothetical protein [Actinomadura glauciflava]